MNEDTNNNIPKKIHYCWFGDKELPDSAKKCIESWKKYCPDYEIVCWNEKNLDIKKYKFAEDAYKDKKWGFVPDVFRLDIIYEHGGIYFDTDVEIVKNFDELLINEAFAGFEGTEYIAFGLGFGAKPKNNVIKEMLDEYSNLDYNAYKEQIEKIASPLLSTQVFSDKGLIKNGTMQSIEGWTLYPEEYFAPKNPLTRLVNFTANTYSIHHYDASWVSEKEKAFINNLEKNARDIMGKYPDKVSIIIPVYNGANFMREAINSALNQTYKNLEIIVINDGSADETEAIAKSYGTSIRYFSKENGGVSSALNLGLKVATGKYISWLSHDDMYHPQKIELEVKEAKKHDENTVIICNWLIINQYGDLLEGKKLDKRLLEFPHAFLAFDRSTWLNGCAMLFHRSLFEKNGDFDITLKSTQDYDMWNRFIIAGVKFHIVEEQLLYSRQHEQQGSSKMSDALFNSDLIHKQIINSMEDLEIDEYFYKDINNYQTTFRQFFDNGYIRTPAYMFKKMFEKLSKEKNIKAQEKLILERLTGEMPNNKSKTSEIIELFNTKSNKPRIMFVSGYWYTGGVERFISNLFSKMVNDYEIILLTPYTDVKSTIELPKEVRHFHMSEGMFYNHCDYVMLSMALLADIKVVVGCMNTFEKINNFYNVAPQENIKTIASNHEHFLYPYNSEYFYNSTDNRQTALQSADAVIWLTKFSDFIYKKMSKSDNSYVIPNPNTFQNDEKDFVKQNNYTVLSVGRFNDCIKRIDRILETFSIVLSKQPNASLVLVGEIDLDQKIINDMTIREMLSRFKLPEENVRLLGNVDNIEKYYSEATVLLLTSESEGFPMVLNEAAAFKVPTVCNYISGITDIIIDGENGYILEQGDIKGLAEKVLLIFEDEKIRFKMMEDAYKLSQRFNIDTIYEKWDSLIKSLLYSKKICLNIDISSDEYKMFAADLVYELNKIYHNAIKAWNSKDKEILSVIEEKARGHNYIQRLKKSLNEKGFVITLVLCIKKVIKKARYAIKK